MFVKKLVEKASRKYNNTETGTTGLKAENVNPRVSFHYGIPPEASTLAYDSIGGIVAVSTRTGLIKLFGKGNTQAFLQYDQANPTKFLQFIENQGILLRVTKQKHIEVWDIDKKHLSYVHIFGEEISSLTVVQQSFYMYVGDCVGNVTILKLDELQHLVQMQYTIPFAESHGTPSEAGNMTAVIFVSPQPRAESKRVLLAFKDGLIILWGIHESKIVYTTGSNSQHLSHHEPKIMLSASWACTFGSKLVAGYNTGDIFVWSIPVTTDGLNNKKELCSQIIPLHKLNLAYKMEKIPIVSLRWSFGEGKVNRLYVNGFSDAESPYSFQVIILNENFESRVIKLALPLTEPCQAMEIVSCINDQNKNRRILLLLLKSGRLCLYDDLEIERYLSQCQSKSAPSLPKPLMMKLPFGDSTITTMELYTNNSASSSPRAEERLLVPNQNCCLFPNDMRENDGTSSTPAQFRGFSKIKNLLLTGHNDGSINLWDISCPTLSLILSIQEQLSESGSSCSARVTSLHFNFSSQTLVSGDQSGAIHIITFNKEHQTSESIFSFLQAKHGELYTVSTAKVKGAIISIIMDSDAKHVAVGTTEGYAKDLAYLRFKDKQEVSVIQMEGAIILYQKQVPGPIHNGVVSLQFHMCGQNGRGRSVLLVGTEESSVLALEEGSGNALTASSVRPKKPSRALLIQILDANPGGEWTPDCQDMNKDTIQNQTLLMICSENAVRLYALDQVIEGIKKVFRKKKLNSKCCHASVVYGRSSDVGLILVFACGKIEIRSLPDLTFLNEFSLRNFTCSFLSSHPTAAIALCSSSEGELVLVCADQAIILFSILSHREAYRHLQSLTQVYAKGFNSSQERISNIKNLQKEKKKGIFSMVAIDFKGNKMSSSQENDAESSFASTSEDLSVTFSTVNFLPCDEKTGNSVKYDKDVELDIDDIDLDEPNKKPRGPNFAGLSKQNIGKKLQVLKGKLKPKTEEKLSPAKEMHEEKVVSAVDQIKKKYGYATNDEETNIAKITVSKLSENVRKLQDINLRTSEMQNSAQSFSSMAKELLRSVQNDKNP